MRFQDPATKINLIGFPLFRVNVHALSVRFCVRSNLPGWYFVFFPSAQPHKHTTQWTTYGLRAKISTGWSGVWSVKCAVWSVKCGVCGVRSGQCQVCSVQHGDPLMPAPFTVGQRAALQTVHSNLQHRETLYAFLDDVYMVLPPHRVRPVHDLLQHHLFHQARIQLNAGKKLVSGIKQTKPPDIQTLGLDVWVGGNEISPHEQELLVLGALTHTNSSFSTPGTNTTSCSSAYQAFKTCRPRGCFSCSAQTRVATTISACPPNITAVFFTGHDMAVAACLPDPSWRQHPCQPLHSPSPTSLSTRGARLGFGNHSATFRLLGFVGRRRPGVTTTSTGGIRTDT